MCIPVCDVCVCMHVCMSGVGTRVHVQLYLYVQYTHVHDLYI